MMSAMLARSRKRARFLVSSALGFFLLGSNYCLLAVAADLIGANAPPACHATVAQERPHACCTGGSQRAPERPGSGPVHGYPCCMLLATASAPVLAKDVSLDAPVAFAPIESAPTLAADVGNPARVLERAGPDPSDEARVPRASRAPPLS